MPELNFRRKLILSMVTFFRNRISYFLEDNQIYRFAQQEAKIVFYLFNFLPVVLLICTANKKKSKTFPVTFNPFLLSEYHFNFLCVFEASTAQNQHNTVCIEFLNELCYIFLWFNWEKNDLSSIQKYFVIRGVR